MNRGRRGAGEEREAGRRQSGAGGAGGPGHQAEGAAGPAAEDQESESTCGAPEGVRPAVKNESATAEGRIRRVGEKAGIGAGQAAEGQAVRSGYSRQRNSRTGSK